MPRVARTLFFLNIILWPVFCTSISCHVEFGQSQGVVSMKGNTFIKALAASFLLLGMVSTANAALISRSVNIDLGSDGSLVNYTGLPARPGWQGDVSVAPFSISAGDQLSLALRFVNGKALRLLDLPGGVEDQYMWLRLLTDGPSAGMDYRVLPVFQYLGVSGQLLENPIVPTDTVGGGGAVGIHTYANLTDTNFAYSGVNINVSFVEFDDRGTPFAFSKVGWTSSSDRVEIIDAVVPEPSPLVLMGLGLAGISFARKKKQCRTTKAL